jgi:uncharacterized protein YbjT (DUF2867 family)
MIVVTGANGTVGSSLVEQLRAAGETVRVVVRSAEKGRAAASLGAEVAVAQVQDQQAFGKAVEGADSLFLNTASMPGFVDAQKSAIDTVLGAGVSRIVRQSAFRASPDDPMSFGRGHAELDAYLQATEAEWTVLEPNGFFSNILAMAGSIRQGGIYTNAGDGKVAMIDPRDIAAVAAATLTEPGHGGQAYLLTGPEAIGYTGVAATLTRLLGHQIGYVPVEDGVANAALLGLGLHAEQAADIVALGAHYAAGQASEVTDDVERLTGKAPRTFETFVADNLAAFA